MDAIKIFAGLSKHLYVSLRYRKRHGGSVEIVVVVCGKICGNMCGNMCDKMCSKIEKLSDWNKNWCGSRY